MARHLLHVFSTFGVGGPQVRTTDLINHFGAKYRHSIIALDGNYECQKRIAPEIQVEFPKVTNPRGNPLKNAIYFRTVLKELRPDVLLTYNWGAIEWGLAAAMAGGFPHYHWEEGFGSDEAGGQKLRRILARRLFLTRARRVIVPSRSLQSVAVNVWKLPAAKVMYLANGVDLKKFSGGSKGQSQGIKVGTIARLRKEKNISRLLVAFASILKESTQPLTLIIAGDGPELEALKEEARTLGILEATRFLGHQSNPEAVMAELDIFAISSDTEQMPISVLEAMAGSLPIVGTRVGDIAEMISSQNLAFLSDPADDASFAQNLARLSEDFELREKLGHANRQRCESLFDIKLMYEAYSKLYDY